MIELRCSSLPLFMKCGQSMRAEMNIKEWFSEAELGTAVHEAARRIVLGLPVDSSAVAVIADLYGADRDEVGFLAEAARRAWDKLTPTPGAIVDAELAMAAVLGDVKLTGTADVDILEADRTAVTVIDWKTGRRDSDHREQVMGYCALALEAHPTVDIALAQIVWLRTNEVEAYSLTRRDMQPWRERLFEQVLDVAYHPGTHCQYCPRKFACPAREEMSRSAVAVMGDGVVAADNVRSLRELPVEQQVALYRKAKAVAGLAADVINEVRALVVETGPLVALGVKLDVVEETRRNVDTMKAWPILQHFLGDEQIAQAVAVQVGKAEDLAAASAPRGEKGARRKEFNDQLMAAGAVSQYTIKKLTERRG